MPFKRAVVLLSHARIDLAQHALFQCPLSGQLCCCTEPRTIKGPCFVSMPFKRAVVLL